MSKSINFGLNHMTTPRLSCRQFIDLAASLGCVGVELRNDLADKKLNTAAFFDGENPSSIGDYARSKNVRLLGLSEAYGFNAWNEAMQAKVQLLVEQAKASGAESINLIPRNDAPKYSDDERLSELRRALSEILPILEAADMIALVEPLGFMSCSLRKSSEAVEAIEAVGGQGRFKLVHDTFHYHLAGCGPLFPQHTGLVHISGVSDPTLNVEDMHDNHRILVDEHDRLGNLAQINAFLAADYTGAFSYEVFAPQVHEIDDVRPHLNASFNLIKAGITA